MSNGLQVILTEEQLERLAEIISNRLNPDSKQPLTVAQAAKALGTSRSTIEKRVHAGVIRCVPEMGRRILIPKVEIERLQEGRLN
ncbi:helix-turn-helix domain-containing protein [Luteolibacter pohnpeiensis]|uniref:Helix-turn-helix domain-containing protein n=1 Tax=Luteolibacter pohnpeiensis TaxID=454153 RepID=A0A934VXM3_9BACT|nr:helix-turn-helix domain-containing protein [Luteolibacter pohnpeiensis]MBK1883639.1 helix-turn-helix domain-containing protein [Luteolibacter pohnpeiensis]